MAVKHPSVTAGYSGYADYLIQQSKPIRRWALLCACVLYLIFSLIDLIRMPDDVLMITLPARILMVWLPLLYGTWLFWKKPESSHRIQLTLLLIIYIAAGLVHCLIRVIAWKAGIDFSHLGMTLILLYGCLLLVLPMAHATIGTLIVLTAMLISLVITTSDPAEIATVMIILCLNALVCLIINRICHTVLEANYKLIRRLNRDVHSDDLTGLYNKRYFNHQFEALMRESIQNRLPAGLLIIEVDNFKKINDSVGQLAADQTLTKMRHLLIQHCNSEEDFVARLGGVRFVIYKHNCVRSEIEKVCRNLISQARDSLVIQTQKHYRSFTSVSIGAAYTPCVREGDEFALIQNAEDALYESQQAGSSGWQLRIVEKTATVTNDPGQEITGPCLDT